ncbi:hypothetical protein DdX_01399 [Ditylenchus destructor]|uniref:Uncharacterized protein n=1 Tax=Ditylenchus destructor TaxID=166010 RepID=A0AAD4NGR2_9BILA|nr:hypothetical protein DdX_01399 [Ditylenchus destructor]
MNDGETSSSQLYFTKGRCKEDSGHQTYDILLPEKHILKLHRKENHEFEVDSTHAGCRCPQRGIYFIGQTIHLCGPTIQSEIIGAPPDYSSLSSGPKPPSLGQGVVAEAVIGIETEPGSALQSVAATAVW